ncbi:hypothetical protein [Streptomyces sp. CCM_MD2014]|uniref:hypothetical protein n=1 Tax=Streptomyces sp. CCM_MD2014 TaxID=1561022 RepID=UPI00052A7D8E|nr:hypothetical protein [Streptomyces sp. CCM_MD2014]AIV35560.1 hypothetical protein NI25_20350 [Streptomyces sp. CCM_MD2014]
MKPTLLDAAEAAGRAAEAHAAACGTCSAGDRLAELCPDGQRIVSEAAHQAAPNVVDPPCPHTSWEVTSEYPARDGSGWVKSRRCADCGDSLDPVTEPEPHWPAAAAPAEVVHACPPVGSGFTPCCGRTPFELPRTDRITVDEPTTCPAGKAPAEETAVPAAPGPARLAALMRSRQHWRDGRVVSEATISQAEIRDALGWTEPTDAPAVQWDRARQAKVRQLVRVITAGRTAFPDLTDEWLVRKSREVLPELLDVVDGLAARVEELEATGCRCYDPTSHAAGCVKAAVRWQGRTYPAAVWYRDGEGEWWAPVSTDTRGCLVLLLDGDHSNEPVPLDRVQHEYGVSSTSYGAHVQRGDLPDAAGGQP